jgi:4-amino-4-deoxy-L-arabinose transferase-like glycosyltransferase
LAVVVGAVWRIGVLVVDKWHQRLLLNDSLYYSGQAMQLARGTWFRELFVDRPGAEHGPLTSILMAPVSWMADPVPWQRCVTVTCGIATIAVLGELGRALGGARAAVLAAWIAALAPNLWMNDGLVMSESVSTLALSAALVLALSLLDRLGDDATGADAVRPRSSSRATLSTGAVLGLAVLARSELVLVAAGVVLLVLLGGGRSAMRVRWRSAVLVSAGVAVVLAPWVGFNLTRFERPVTLTTNDGTTLLGSYCPATFSGRDLGGWSLACVVDDPAYRYEEEPSVRSARQRSLAVHFASAHLRRLPLVVAARVGRTFDLVRLDSSIAQDVGEERWRWASWSGIVSFWILAPLTAVGWRRMRRTARHLLLAPLASVVVTTVVFYGAHRIRSAAEPVLVVVGALGLVAVVDGWGERRRGRVA